MLQKAIEDNILAGKVDFDNSLSAEAKAAITAMLNPKDTQRPLAKDIFALNFFVRHGKGAGPAQFPLKAPTTGANSALSLKQKVEQYEKRLEHLIATNKSLSELCEQKDRLIGDNIGSLEPLTKQLIAAVS